MIKVITYGTYDLLHEGHRRLLERAKALGDYLIVAVTSDDFDRKRGKINVQQSLMERIEGVKQTGLADEIIIEEYEGQKIDDIKRFNIDIFTVGTDWLGKFDYLKEYCEVVYLERTEGVSSTQIRSYDKFLNIGFVGESSVVNKFYNESGFVNGMNPVGIYSEKNKELEYEPLENVKYFESYEELLKESDAVCIISHPKRHYAQIKSALQKGVHVICEPPMTLSVAELEEVNQLAKNNNLILMISLKTAYSTAFYRMVLMLKGGCIGDIVSVDATCTSLQNYDFSNENVQKEAWSSICAWGPVGMLPVFQILGTSYKNVESWSLWADENQKFDLFTKLNFVYDNAVATVNVGKGVKSEGDLVITGTRGYLYVPAPWWKTDYFEVRYENQSDNKRYFYQLEGEGIRYELVNFLKSVKTEKNYSYVDYDTTKKIVEVIENVLK